MILFIRNFLFAQGEKQGNTQEFKKLTNFIVDNCGYELKERSLEEIASGMWFSYQQLFQTGYDKVIKIINEQKVKLELESDESDLINVNFLK